MTRRIALRSLAFLSVLAPRWIAEAQEPAVKALGPIAIHIEDEFAPLKAAIVHDAANAIDIDENLLEEWDVNGRKEEHPETGLNSCQQVVKEMTAFRKILRGAGVELFLPEPVEDAYCQIFTRDPCFAIGKTLFVGVMADEHREGEVNGLDRIRDACDSVVELDEANVAIEGGDVMVLNRGRRVLIGVHENTNDAGFQALSRHLKNQGVEAIAIPHRTLHLDCCLAPLPDGSALFAPWRLPKSSMHRLKSLFKTLIPLDKDEASRQLAANILWLDPENVVSGANAPRTNAKLRSLGYKVHATDFTHVKRMWGSFRCAICPLKRG